MVCQILYIYRKAISPGMGLKKIMEEKYNQFNNIVNRLFTLDKDDVVTVILAPKHSDIFVGADFSFRDW
jgi:hypothetical protein